MQPCQLCNENIIEQRLQPSSCTLALIKANFTNMQDLKTLETQELLNMLSRYAADYSRLMLEGTKEEFEQCKSAMSAIQDELNSRKQADN